MLDKEQRYLPLYQIQCETKLNDRKILKAVVYKEAEYSLEAIISETKETAFPKVE